jgi:hypothetical protein
MPANARTNYPTDPYDWTKYIPRGRMIDSEFDNDDELDDLVWALVKPEWIEIE